MQYVLPVVADILLEWKRRIVIADNVVRNARAEAERILSQARSEADSLARQAQAGMQNQQSPAAEAGKDEDDKRRRWRMWGNRGS